MPEIKDWFLYGEWYDIYWFHDCYFFGLTDTIKEYLGYGLSQVVNEQQGNIQRIYFSKREWNEIGRRYLSEIIENPDRLANVLKSTRKASAELIGFSERLKKIEVKKIDKKEQIRLIKQYHQLHHRIWALGQIPNTLELENSYLTDYLKSWLKQNGFTGQKLLESFVALSTPLELSMAQKESLEMLKLAILKNPDAELDKHHSKYSWLHFGWTGPSLELDYFIQVHRGLYKQGNARQLLTEEMERQEELKESKAEIFESLHISEDIKYLFQLLEEVLFIKAHRMDALYMSYEAIQPLLKKIAKDNYISLSQIYYLYCDWLIEMLENGDFNTDKINKIKRHSVWYFDGEKKHLLSGPEADKFMDSIRDDLPKIEAVDELKGESAYPGKVQGKVTIVNLASEMDKFSEGDILVSNVTDPSLLPIMHKAKAFVTNMGGLTCHAAIVARELQTPCVIGTKIATKVFKDGDEVEVDANKGVVKKIS